jgi:hypothetical protein
MLQSRYQALTQQLRIQNLTYLHSNLIWKRIHKPELKCKQPYKPLKTKKKKEGREREKKKILAIKWARESSSHPTLSSSDRLGNSFTLFSIPFARKTLRISFTIGRYDSHADTCPPSFSPPMLDMARAAIMDNSPVPALCTKHKLPLSDIQTST